MGGLTKFLTCRGTEREEKQSPAAHDVESHRCEKKPRRVPNAFQEKTTDLLQNRERLRLTVGGSSIHSLGTTLALRIRSDSALIKVTTLQLRQENKSATRIREKAGRVIFDSKTPKHTASKKSFREAKKWQTEKECRWEQMEVAARTEDPQAKKTCTVQNTQKRPRKGLCGKGGGKTAV